MRETILWRSFYFAYLGVKHRTPTELAEACFRCLSSVFSTDEEKPDWIGVLDSEAKLKAVQKFLSTFKSQDSKEVESAIKAIMQTIFHEKGLPKKCQRVIEGKKQDYLKNSFF